MRASRAGVSVVAPWPACLLNSPASRSSRNRLLQRLINASLQSSLSRIAAQVWFASSNNISRARRASSARPLRLAARWLSSRRSESVSTMGFSMNTIILPFQMLQYTRRATRRAGNAIVHAPSRKLSDFLSAHRTETALRVPEVAKHITAPERFQHMGSLTLLEVGFPGWVVRVCFAFNLYMPFDECAAGALQP